MRLWRLLAIFLVLYRPDDKEGCSSDNHSRAQNLSGRDIQKRYVEVRRRGASVDGDPVADIGIWFAEIFNEKTREAVADGVDCGEESVKGAFFPENINC